MLHKNRITGKCFLDGQEITEAEYVSALRVIREKAKLVNAVDQGSTGIDDVPEAWRDEIRRRVEERRAAAEAAENEPEGED